MKKNSLNEIKNAFVLAWNVDKTCIIVMTIAALCTAAISVIGILMSSYCVESLAHGVGHEIVIKYVMMGVAAIFILTLCGKYAEKLENTHIYHTETELNSEITEKSLNMDFELLHSPEIQNIKKRMSNDSAWGWGIVSFYWDYKKLVCCIFGMVLSLIVIFPMFSVTMAKQSPSFIIIMVSLLLINIIISYYNCAICKRKVMELMNEKRPGTLYSYIAYDEGITYNNGKDIRIYKGHRVFESNFASHTDEIKEISRRFGKYMGRSQRNISILKAMAMCGSYFAVVMAALKGAITMGDMIKYAGAVYLICDNLSTLIDTFSDFKVTCNRQQSSMDYLNYPNKMYIGKLPVEKMYFCDNGDNDYEIEFKDVSFKYPTSQVYSLEHINFKFKVGEKLAVVGMNGSGKTTMIKLLCRLYDPTEGEILLNGVNIKNYDYKEYMSIFSVVFQDFRLLSFPLGQNVSCSCEYDKKKAMESLEQAGFKDRVDAMDKGLETCLYNDFESGSGVEISGGEAQKIALARALYKNSPFIILDEPTAAMDPVAEYDIYSRFNKVVGDKTAIYISHRLSSCIFCDSIVVFHEGRIIQRGSHEELLKDKAGKYYELWNAQAKYYV